MKKNWLIISGIAIILFFIYMYNLGVPPLLDSDETRYADMARCMLTSKNFTTLYLDGRIFWDKPPMFFWILCLFYKIFGVNEFAVRLPSVLAALSVVAANYFVVKKASSKLMAAVSSLILASSVEFIIFSRISILDMVLTANIALSLMCGFMTYFVQDQNKKYFWYGFYLFSALGILTKGIPAFVIPFGTMFLVGIWKKNLMEFFKVEYFLPGVLLFMFIVLPWHIEMYKLHGAEFIKEYIIKHHFQRFIGNAEIGREHSIIYYIPTFIVGFLPWTLSFLAGFKKLFTEKRNDLVTMNLIGFIFTFVFFSVAGTKLITYILPVYPMCAVLCAYMWTNIRFKKEINFSIKFTSVVFIIFAVLVSFAVLYLPAEIHSIIKPVQIPTILVFLICALFWRNKLQAFISYLVLIAFLAGIMIPKYLNIWYSFGQNELMSYAKYAKEYKLPLGAYNLWERFSLQYYYDGNVEYFQNGDAYGAKYVQTTPFRNSFKKDIVVINNSSLPDIKFKYRFIVKGKRYSLIEECHG